MRFAMGTHLSVVCNGDAPERVKRSGASPLQTVKLNGKIFARREEERCLDEHIG